MWKKTQKIFLTWKIFKKNFYNREKILYKGRKNKFDNNKKLD